ncbi:major facilitator superfamily domain-containing protein [Papiliotrema laurentii]|uniref:Major facilitator superfamily domain-containing protein n=1 Tax=Papiliotrema laurentii TaxID=5418 RepID=A0AAD9L8E6_PAPLA|nr:major facilitator superfamily domain-containing protein [Papiliotrema laurentii]
MSEESIVMELSKPVVQYPNRTRQYVLLGIFALTMFIDVLAASAFFVFTGAVSRDLEIPFAQQSWVITSYAVTFASFLVFWGKNAELLGPKTIFCPAFFCVGVLSLVISFITNRYAFFVLRGIAGVAAAALVPTAYRLIGIAFPLEKRSKAYTLYGMTGSIANVTGTIIAGVVALIPRDQGVQMVEWRWFFRIVAVLAIVLTLTFRIAGALISFWIIPKDAKPDGINRQTWKRLDVPGLVMLQCAIILFITGLTLGASYGWGRATFLAPFLIAIVLFPLFFWRESRIPYDNALIPSALWRLPNFLVLVLLSLLTLGWWSVMFLPFIETFHDVHGETYLLSALRTLPIGVSAGFISVVLVLYPSIIARPKWPIVISLTLSSVAYVLFTQAPSVVGKTYWSYLLPGMLIGSAGMQVVLLSTNVGLVLAAPPEMSGLVGAVYQTGLQTSSVIALSIQAGLLTTFEGGIQNLKNLRASFYFELGWTVLWLIGFTLLYRSSKEPHRSKTLDGEGKENLEVPLHV